MEAKNPKRPGAKNMTVIEARDHGIASDTHKPLAGFAPDAVVSVQLRYTTDNDGNHLLWAEEDERGLMFVPVLDGDTGLQVKLTPAQLAARGDS